MADKSFGVKQVNLINASGTPRIESPNNLNINAVNVAISTDISVGGQLSLGTGTSISSPATNILTLGTNSVERVRINSSGDVGIGTDNPGYKLHVEGTGETALTIEGDAAPSESGGLLILKNNNTTANSLNQIQSADAGGQTTSAISFYNVDNATNEGYMLFLTRPSGGVPTEAARFTSAGNLKFPSGQGIDFSATSDATGMQSELLDDYEEGTWTPALADANTGGNTVTHQIQNGLYTKVGNVVTAYFRITWTSLASASGIVRLRGFPFTAKSNSGQYYYMGSTANRHGQISVAIEGNNSIAIFFDSSSNAGTFSELSSADTSIGMNGTVTYLAA